MRMIDADKFILALMDASLSSVDEDTILDLVDSIPTVDAVDCIFFMDTADVAPVRHGRWDKIPNSYISVATKNGSYSGSATSCSVCKEINPNAYKTNYCPNCGAKMDGGADHEVD